MQFSSWEMEGGRTTGFSLPIAGGMKETDKSRSRLGGNLNRELARRKHL